MVAQRRQFVRLIVFALSAMLAWPGGVALAFNDGPPAREWVPSTVLAGQYARARDFDHRTHRDVDPIAPGMLSDDDEVGAESPVPGAAEWWGAAFSEPHDPADRCGRADPRASGRAQPPPFNSASVHLRC